MLDLTVYPILNISGEKCLLYCEVEQVRLDVMAIVQNNCVQNFPFHDSKNKQFNTQMIQFVSQKINLKDLNR